ncbi:hypothetical protein [Alkalimarinus sediminis]|uniref:Uncharacterized protein n=1 Tax=Alkalimarinus sediminis TaxID=1632866 RepID=A0A9E8HHP3_9ALTE|nr:hypothetical protein [Alkalimarinus sediminis]UZW74865.1 hypothetical protein NNL22_17875 [Alkalimarinus sediminis]
MSLIPQNITIRSVFASLFSIIFFGLSLVMVISAFAMLAEGIMEGQELMQICLKAINTGVISLAVFELAMVINKEYGGDEQEHDVVVMLRRTLPRFIGTVCVALALEGLIMVIKYSQLDLAGNLYYPVAIIFSAAFLLAALGVFLKLSPDKSNVAATQVVTPQGAAVALNDGSV